MDKNLCQSLKPCHAIMEGRKRKFKVELPKEDQTDVGCLNFTKATNTLLLAGSDAHNTQKNKHEKPFETYVTFLLFNYSILLLLIDFEPRIYCHHLRTHLPRSHKHWLHLVGSSFKLLLLVQLVKRENNGKSVRRLCVLGLRFWVWCVYEWGVFW